MINRGEPNTPEQRHGSWVLGVRVKILTVTLCTQGHNTEPRLGYLVYKTRFLLLWRCWMNEKLSWKATFLGQGEGESFQKPSYYRSNRAHSKNSRGALPELWRRRALILWGWGPFRWLLFTQRTTARCRSDVKWEFEDEHQRQKSAYMKEISLNGNRDPACPTLEKAS